MAKRSSNSGPSQADGGPDAENRPIASPPAGCSVLKWPRDLLREGNVMLVSVLLFVLVAWVFLPSIHNGFVSLDDPFYLHAKAPVQSGLSRENM